MLLLLYLRPTVLHGASGQISPVDPVLGLVAAFFCSARMIQSRMSATSFPWMIQVGGWQLLLLDAPRMIQSGVSVSILRMFPSLCIGRFFWFCLGGSSPGHSMASSLHRCISTATASLLQHGLLLLAAAPCLLGLVQLSASLLHHNLVKTGVSLLLLGLGLITVSLHHLGLDLLAESLHHRGFIHRTASPLHNGPMSIIAALHLFSLVLLSV